MTRSFTVKESPALEAQTGASFAMLVDLMRHLLAPDGCPWDREQTPATLCRYVIEEACELVDAIESGEEAHICDELGDLALQIAFLSELYRAKGAFGPDQVMEAICRKLVRRHPHVFGEDHAETSAEVEVSWERIKREEKRQRPLLDGIPRNLPALARANRTGEIVKKVGFDWPDPSGPRQKVDEELAELEAAITEGEQSRIEDEFGDLLFSLANWARHLGVDPERSLRGACDKFRARFDEVERRVKSEQGDWPRDERGRPAHGVGAERLEQHWVAAKAKLALR
jgi:MazG family protein